MTAAGIPREWAAENALGKLAAIGCDLAPLDEQRGLLDAIRDVPPAAPTYVDQFRADVMAGRIKPDEIETRLAETAAREIPQDRWNAYRTAVAESAAARLLAAIREHGQAFLGQMRQPFDQAAGQLAAAIDGLGGVTDTGRIADDEQLAAHYRQVGHAVGTLSTVADGVRSLADVGYLRNDNAVWLWFVALGDDYSSADQLPRPKPEHPFGPWAAWIAGGHTLSLATDPADQQRRAARWRDLEAGRTPVDPLANATPTARSKHLGTASSVMS